MPKTATSNFKEWSEVIQNMPIICIGCGKKMSKQEVLYLPITIEEYPRREFCSPQCNIDWLLHQAEELEIIAKEYREVAKIRAKEIGTVITTGRGGICVQCGYLDPTWTPSWVRPYKSELTTVKGRCELMKKLLENEKIKGD